MKFPDLHSKSMFAYTPTSHESGGINLQNHIVISKNTKHLLLNLPPIPTPHNKGVGLANMSLKKFTKHPSKQAYEVPK